MIYKLLLNLNNFIYYVFALFSFALLVYLVYKLFILENDMYIINDKINKIEVEFGFNNKINPSNVNQEEINFNEILMNNIFNDTNDVNDKEVDILDIDKIDIINNDTEVIITEPIFDLKKEIIADDKESVMSNNNLTKKKLQKLNLDKLKEKCEEFELSSEGTKAQLIDRILEKDLQK